MRSKISVSAPLGLCLFLSLVVAACSPSSETSAGGEAPGASDLYVIQGDVLELPEEDVDRPRLRIRHQAIPEFKNRDGEVEGMKAMTMSFDLAPDLALTGLEVYDKIEFTLEVDWTHDRPARVVAWSHQEE